MQENEIIDKKVIGITPTSEIDKSKSNNQNDQHPLNEQSHQEDE